MMNLKNKYPGQSKRVGREFWFFAFGLPLLIAASSFAEEAVTSEHLDPIIFLAANQPTTPQNLQQTNIAPKSDKTTNQKDSSISKILNSEPARRLWKAEVAAPAGEKNDKGEKELLQIIEQLRSIKLEAKKQSVRPAVTAEPPPITSATTEATPQKPDEEQIESGLLTKPLTKQTLQMADDLLKHPEQIDNPLELGEILFLSGYQSQAAIAYQEALKRMEPDYPSSARDRSWILFQIGNCLRTSDPATAAKMYKQLLAEYPNSQWADAAKAQDQLAEWFQKDNPKTFVADNKN